MPDVDPETFNVRLKTLNMILKTKAIVPVHLYGQSANMEEIISLSKKYNLKVIEDNTQAIGCNYFYNNGTTKKTGTIGDIFTSFFPQKFGMLWRWRSHIY